MALSCSCSYDRSPGDILWFAPKDYSQLNATRARKCACCGARINPGDLVLAFTRIKVAQTDIEIAIYGEDDTDTQCGPPRATHYLGEPCGCADIWLSLDELGFCFDYRETREALADYRKMTKRKNQ